MSKTATPNRKGSLAGRAEEIHARAEQEARERAEQRRKAQMEDFQRSVAAGASSSSATTDSDPRNPVVGVGASSGAGVDAEGSGGNDGVCRSTPLNVRGEEILRRAERERQAKLEQLKKEKMAEFLASGSKSRTGSVKHSGNAAGGSGGASNGDEEGEEHDDDEDINLAAMLKKCGVGEEAYHSMSLKDRQLLLQRYKEQEQAEKLQELKRQKLTAYLTPQKAPTRPPRKEDSKSLSRSIDYHDDDAAAAAAGVDSRRDKSGSWESTGTDSCNDFSYDHEEGEVGEEEEEEDEDLSHLTPLERKERQKAIEARRKERRLKAYIRASRPHGDSVDTNEEVSKLSAKERYERAKREQQRVEAERLEQFRSQSNKKLEKRLSARNMSLRDVWESALEEESAQRAEDLHQSLSASTSRKLLPKRSSARMKESWNEALSESRSTQEERFMLTKKQTISQFRITDGTGIVRRRIDEWEELFETMAASLEQMEATLYAAKELSARKRREEEESPRSIEEWNRAIKEFRDNSDKPEIFEIGSTRIYNAKLLERNVSSYLKKVLQQQSKGGGGGGGKRHFPLSCGVYGDQSGKPPIDVFAAAMQMDDQAQSIYVALTVKAVPGMELNAAVYGLKKVAVFSKELDHKVLERVLDIVPQPGWESWVAQGSYDDSAPGTTPLVKPRAGSGASSYDEDEDGLSDGEAIILHDPMISPLEGYPTETKDVDHDSVVDGKLYLVDGNAEVVQQSLFSGDLSDAYNEQGEREGGREGGGGGGGETAASQARSGGGIDEDGDEGKTTNLSPFVTSLTDAEVGEAGDGNCWESVQSITPLGRGSPTGKYPSTEISSLIIWSRVNCVSTLEIGFTLLHRVRAC